MNNPFEKLLTLEEAKEQWDLKDSDILENILNNVFIKDKDVKNFDGTWLITTRAMEREYGKIGQDPSLIMSNMPYATMRYESYIRNAFQCERGQDPANLADGDIFDIARDIEEFYRAKAGVSYAAIIYNNRLLDGYGGSLTPEEKRQLKDLAEDIISTKNKDELYEAMDKHNSLILSIEDKY